MCLKKTSKPPAEKPFRKASLKKAQEEEEDLLALERTKYQNKALTGYQT